MNNIYYIAPDNNVFEEVKAKAITVWSNYDNAHGYVTEKVDRIKDLENTKDNFMYIVLMFDFSNQIKLSQMLSEFARIAIRERMKAGGTPMQYIYF